MSENVLNCICELESVDVAETELYMSIHNEFREFEDFSAQVECVSEAGLLSLLRGERSRITMNKQSYTFGTATHLTGFRFML